jgi:hypothetical protein
MTSSGGTSFSWPPHSVLLQLLVAPARQQEQEAQHMPHHQQQQQQQGCCHLHLQHHSNRSKPEAWSSAL